ncbi:glycosyl hydrolase family 95 catalytic domain-containing protein [Flagellimonas hadalis]|uniref:Glycoside hydrolase family 95 protein n=1 Tax=Flagellimonas hadalis TaxID=2597517 RepID=A0A5N5IRY8_9FLAO|nr:glycoside hydrolase N-terminal domain-containing protein [Allomuricauda hadalis]KAB5488200.1 glycoside hydrolase family 95 protein [Allomuricauda hadalis]
MIAKLNVSLSTNHLVPKSTWVLVFVLATIFSSLKAQDSEKVLWYSAPAEEWMQALPIGNGRLGAMVFGNPFKEHLQLNEDSMWAGGPDWEDAQGNPEDLEELRRLLREGKTTEVDSLIVEKFSNKTILRSHQTMGDLFIDFKESGEITNYRRELDLDQALASTFYTRNGNHYTQKVFASQPDDAMVMEITTTSPKGLNLELSLSRPEDHGKPTVKVSNPSQNQISMVGQVTQYGGKRFSKPLPIDHGVRFEVRLQVVAPDGKITAKEGKVSVKGARKVLIFIVGNTSFYHGDSFAEKNKETLSKITQQSFESLLDRHISDYQQLYRRVNFELGESNMAHLPTDERLQHCKDGGTDLGLQSLLFQYGRYLLISSSRPNTNPANLQGIWNEHLEAPWNADYHLNINLQMNYWPAEVTNLSELHQPFFNLIDRVLERGRKTAKEQYGITRGSLAHHTTDLWATPFMRAERAYWGSWIHGGGWCAQHYWEHYQFTQDKDFLRHRAYPVLKDIASFYLDWLTWDTKSQKWISSPETSPENSYYNQEGKSAAVSMGSAMGHQIIGEVFDNFLETAQILGIEDKLVEEVKTKKASLHPGVIVGTDGRILEWNEPYDEPEKGHRHVSHLYALHPGDDITENHPEAFAAAQKTIDYRLEHGGAGTGWSRVWMINMNARLLDGASAEENINKFFQISLADNMFDMHPPFQIDGNFGYTAGVAELLIQSHEGIVRLLPALPPNWKNGKITGLKARGNIEVDISWKNGTLGEVTFRSPSDTSFAVKYGSSMVDLQLKANEETQLNAKLKKTND